jgi:hypothetical protein
MPIRHETVYVEVSKAEIIQALRTEPVRPGNWITIEDDDGPLIATAADTIDDPRCTVCAVGGVFRRILAPHNTIERVRKHLQGLHRIGFVMGGHRVQKELDEGNYLNALSCFYEESADIEKTIEFVERRFPDTITIAINNLALRSNP